MKRQNFAMCVVVAVALSGCNNSTPAGPKVAVTPVTIRLNAVDHKLNESGTATLAATDDKTLVTINVTNEPKGERQSVFMMYGTCSHLNPWALYPLSDLIGGRSVSIYALPLDELLTMGPNEGTGPGPGHSPFNTPTPSGLAGPGSFAILAWRYTLLSKTLVTCGEYPAGP